ncbi:MAG: PQQ-binding-like beta-propeller repeat protein, partial [Phycisphaerae bacterium]|nr:PQQ-binding-like beta-propeller repeat protein [Phycisphaerae bacterium]
RTNGKVLYYHLSGSPGADRKREGGSHASAIGSFFLNHRGINTILYDLKTGSSYRMWQGTTYPVLIKDVLYLSGNPVSAYSLKDLKKTSYKTKEGQRSKWQIAKLWELEVASSGALIKAGDRLYAGGDGVISAIDVSRIDTPKKVWSARVSGRVARLIAADDRLFAVTLRGRIYAFGPEVVKPTVFSERRRITPSGEPSAQTKQMLSRASLRKGYCLAFGLGSSELAEQIARSSELQVIAVDPDEEKVAALRRRLDDAGLYGQKISVHVGDVNSFNAPSYLAVLTVCEDLKAAGLEKGQESAKRLFNSIRPYGGTAWLAVADDKQYAVIARLIEKAGLARVKVERVGAYAVISRPGSLPGSDDWTHQYGDIANTAKSDDKLVKTPLGLLWFGGNSNHDILPRHGHGPPEQVVAGRLFIQGMNMLSARDVYTGKVLWKRTFPALGTDGVFYDGDDTGQPHIPGANARGTNYVVAPDRIYLAIGGKCAVLDPATGKTLNTFRLPASSRARRWAYLGVYKDLLIGGAGFVPFSRQYEVKPESVWDNFDTSSCRELVVMNRFSGKVLWRRPARQGFRHNSIVAGRDKLFCIDALPESVVDALERRGKTPKQGAVLTALDIHTGREVWKKNKDVFGTWLGYSTQHDILLQSGRKSSDMLKGEPTDRIMALRGRDGKIVWDKPVTHTGPLMIHGNTIYLNTVGARNLLTGQEKLRVHPLTGEKVPWCYHRMYGCNYVIASEYL